MKPPHGPRRPSIGVTADFALPTPDAPSARYEIKAAYADAVSRAGGLPFILPYTDEHAVLELYLDRVSGVLISGGAFDIPPDFYGDAPREGLGTLKPQRTKFELALLKAALERNLPVLGICGGMQLLNVALGGTLVQDIVREIQGAASHQQNTDRTQPHHPVEVKDGTVLADCVGKGQLMVNSTHHQAIKALGPKLTASAHASDGVVEGIESKEYAFAVGVQWHPEMLIDTVPPNFGLYKTFVAKARDLRR